MSQGMWVVSRSLNKTKNDLFPRAPERNAIKVRHVSEILTFLIRYYICVVLSHEICNKTFITAVENSYTILKIVDY